jgi:hypothetical protein
VAYTVTNLVVGSSARQWRVVKGLDADDTFAITHGLGVAPILLPTITHESIAQADITAAKAGLPCVESVSATVINGRMSTAVGSATTRAIVTAHIPVS